MSFQAYKYEIRRLPPPTFFTYFMVAEVVYCSLDIQIVHAIGWQNFSRLFSKR